MHLKYYLTLLLAVGMLGLGYSAAKYENSYPPNKIVCGPSDDQLREIKDEIKKEEFVEKQRKLWEGRLKGKTIYSAHLSDGRVYLVFTEGDGTFESWSYWDPKGGKVRSNYSTRLE
jgi:hypothetical protein